MAPPRLPKPLVTRLHAELIKVLKEPATNKRLVGLGSTPVGTDHCEIRHCEARH